MKPLLSFTLVLCFSLLIGCATQTKPLTAKDCLDKGFTPWISKPEVHSYLASLNVLDPGTDWEHKHWLTAVQGRWHDGGPQFRFKLSSAPTDKQYEWFWTLDGDKACYSQDLSIFSDYSKLIYSSSYTWPDGSVHYIAIWQKPSKQ